MSVQFEVTDTFSGEANYSWVNREEYKGSLTERGAVRKLKAMMGVTGQRCEVNRVGGDDISVRPTGRRAPCIIGFATFYND